MIELKEVVSFNLLVDGIHIKSELPKWARYASVDQDGEVWVFDSKPDLCRVDQSRYGYWAFNDKDSDYEVMQVGDVGPNSPSALNWKESLLEIKK